MRVEIAARDCSTRFVAMKTKHILRLMAMPTDFKQNGSDEARAC